MLARGTVLLMAARRHDAGLKTAPHRCKRIVGVDTFDGARHRVAVGSDTRLGKLDAHAAGPHTRRTMVHAKGRPPHTGAEIHSR